VDYAARFGGDEFVVIMPEADSKIAMEAAKRITAVLSRPFQDVGCVQISVGTAVWDQSKSAIEDLLKTADEVLYRAKAGRPEKYATGSDFKGNSVKA
jgi:diguanylate cyclase (GGDEF)-like protein